MPELVARLQTSLSNRYRLVRELGQGGALGSERFLAEMPYVAGESLRARLSRDKQLPVDEALRLVQEVASALDYANRQGVVRRDIEPENTLINDGSVLVADFGKTFVMVRRSLATHRRPPEPPHDRAAPAGGSVTSGSEYAQA